MPSRMVVFFRQGQGVERAEGDAFKVTQTRARHILMRVADGNPPEAVIVKAEEGHGFGKVENNVDLYNQIFAFLERHIGQPRKP